MKKLTCLMGVFVISINLFSQKEGYQISDFFKLNFYHQEDGLGFFEDADSLNNTDLEEFGNTMYAFSQYLLANYTDAGKRQNARDIKQALPDTIGAAQVFNTYLERDTVFQKMYFDFLEKKEIPFIHIDKLVEIACRFYYLHRLENGKIVMHICARINEVKEMPQNKYSPYYNAFAYSVIRNSGCDDVDWLSSFESDLVYNADSAISNEELKHLKNKNYEVLKASQDFKKNIINEYLRRNQYLNFRLIYE